MPQTGRAGRRGLGAGPAFAGRPCAHSERRGARRTFTAGKEKRPPLGERRAGSTVFNVLAALHKTCPKRGVQAAAALGRGLPSPEALCSFREARGGPPFRGSRPQGPALCRRIKPCASRAALAFARFFAAGRYRLPRRTVLWYNMSTWRSQAQAKDEAGGTAATPLTGPGRKALGGFRECGMMCPLGEPKCRRRISLAEQLPRAF